MPRKRVDRDAATGSGGTHGGVAIGRTTGMGAGLKKGGTPGAGEETGGTHDIRVHDAQPERKSETAKRGAKTGAAGSARKGAAKSAGKAGAKSVAKGGAKSVASGGAKKGGASKGGAGKGGAKKGAAKKGGAKSSAKSGGSRGAGDASLVNTVARGAGRVAARVVNAIESVTGAGRKRSR
jgi:hypothetical protein